MWPTHSRRACQLFSAGWWLRVLAAVVFAWSINYERAHLSVEAHTELPAAAYADQQALAGVTAESHGHDHGHEAHSASDHSLRMAPPAQAAPLVIESALATALSEPEPPQPHFLHFLTERQNPPGIPPPDPLQPRAPPIV